MNDRRRKDLYLSRNQNSFNHLCNFFAMTSLVIECNSCMQLLSPGPFTETKSFIKGKVCR